MLPLVHTGLFMKTHTKTRRSLADQYFGLLHRRGTSDKIILTLAAVAVCAAFIWFIGAVNAHYVTTVPAAGGSLVEGVVGTPRFVNPVLAITRADHDMVALVYSGLVKLNESGHIVPDVAESITVSEDGRTYHVQLRKNVTFHDGSPLTAKDVSYTIALIQNPELKSPLQGNWDGVLVEELGDYELNIVLEEPYTPFIENLRVGILPRELWDELPTEQLPFSQHNTEPIGSGPYKVTDVLRSKSGLINGYKLDAFPNYGANPNISTLVFNFYQDETDLAKALDQGLISSTVMLSDMDIDADDYKNYEVVEQTLPRTFAIYFNQNKSTAARDSAVREALNVAIDRQALIDEVLSGFGTPTYGPVPPGFADLGTTTLRAELPTDLDRLTKARAILTASGWSQNQQGRWVKDLGETEGVLELKINLTTANSELFDRTATFVAEAWEALGVEVSVSEFEQADLIQTIIRPRSYEALLFGADIGRSVDLYPFWHSSQKDDPGLNIVQYTNIDTDALLRKIRLATNEAERDELVRRAVTTIDADAPAIFLFSPTFRYLFDPEVEITPLARVGSQSDRFANISTWHIKSDKVWPIFQNNPNQ